MNDAEFDPYDGPMVYIDPQDLSGKALDWAVGQVAEYRPVVIKPWRRDDRRVTLCDPYHVYLPEDEEGPEINTVEHMYSTYAPSNDTNWNILGPLLSANEVRIGYTLTGIPVATTAERTPTLMSGDTVNIAVCRAIVDKYTNGKAINVPLELMLMENRQ